MSREPLSPGRMLLLGIQHVFAMFGATVLVPTLTGLSVSATLLFAGAGTLLFHLFTQKKIPAFLGSSFAFLGGYAAIKQLAQSRASGLLASYSWIPYAGIGVVCAGFMYVVIAILFRSFGTRQVMRFFPPVVTGPIIICIGISLSASAVNNCAASWPIALLAVFTVVVFNIWGKGLLRLIPILMGVVVSYTAAAFAGQVDFTEFLQAPLIGLPIKMEETVFALFDHIDASLALSSLVAMVPISLATIIEHIGDICAISSTVGKNFIADPGLHTSLMGDGLATSLAALFGAPANTTYGENTGVLALTGVYDPAVIRLAAIISILLSFCPKFSALVHCMPTATIGGVSLILYGMISAVGVRNVVENHVDFSKSRNVILAALIRSLGLGISFSTAGAIVFDIGTMSISLSGLAVAALAGIVLNAILPGNDYEFDAAGSRKVTFVSFKKEP